MTLGPEPHLQLFGATYGQRGPTAPSVCDLSLESMKVGQFSSHQAAAFLPQLLSWPIHHLLSAGCDGLR